jgi:hypothetical protein
MRTLEQIQNLRFVMAMTIGPIAFMFSDASINNWADKLQAIVLAKDPGIRTWAIRIRTKYTINTDWTSIKTEPKNPHCSCDAIVKSCNNLLIKYPSIIAIQVVDIATGVDQIFDRK